jgi:hypothetical protein
MKKLFCFALFFTLLVTSLSSASIDINPSSIESGKMIEITIDMNSYGNYVYFYDGAENMVGSYSLGCVDNLCSKEMSFQYLINESYFNLGNYRVAVYSHDENRWLFSDFKVVEYKCIDGTLVGYCSVVKPRYCGEGEILVTDCLKCGCLSGYDCLEGRCVETKAEKLKCTDGTLVGECSVTKPRYCGEGEIMIDNCLECGCIDGYDCSEGRCVKIIEGIIPDDFIKYESSVGPNKKNEKLYSDKEVFLVSDYDWKEVLPFVSAAVWTDGDEIRKYPFLMYHEEKYVSSYLSYSYYKYDIDSSIYFMQQYGPNKLTVIGDTPQEIDDLLIYKNDGSDVSGPGLSQDQIQKISTEDYLSYWETFDKVVYVEDNYELALLASTYASLINAPLIIKGSVHDSSDVFDKRDVICVGDVAPIKSSCGEKYNLEELRNKYKTETNTDKVILINPTDWDEYISGGYLSTDKTSSSVNELYAKTSLVSPILASAKHELILGTDKTDYIEIDNFIGTKLSNINYLTIMAASNVIPHTTFRQQVLYLFDWALDSSHYADINGDYIPDVAVGRIAGLTNSDVSSYVARSIFYDTFPKTENTKFMASSFAGSLALISTDLSFVFSLAGYNSESKATILPADSNWDFFTSEDWKNQDLIFYLDHGMPTWSGIYSNKIPLLDNSLVFSVACQTVSTYRSNSFWAIAMRKGAIGYYGATSTTGLNSNYMNILNEIYSGKTSTIGGAFKEQWSTFIMHGMTTLIGDPTLDINPPHNIGFQSGSNICNPEKELCLTNGQCCDDLQCELFTCKGCQEEKNLCLFNTDCCDDLQCSWATCSDCHSDNEGCLVKNDCCDNTAGCYMFECGLREKDEICIVNDDCKGNLKCNWFTCSDCHSEDESCMNKYDCCDELGGCHMSECGLREKDESCVFDIGCEGSLECRWFKCADKCYASGTKVGGFTFKSESDCCNGVEQITKKVCRLGGGKGCKWYSHTKIVNDYKVCK